ncbi:hypothetical protein LXL04_016649 [Taraxacum kok-saghyz]
MKRFLQELGFMQKQYVVLCDNESAIHLAKNSMYHKRTKHIDVRYHCIRDCLEDKMFELEKVHTNDNGSDMLTKIYRQCFAFSRRSNGPFAFVFGQRPHDIKAFVLSGWIAHFCSGGSEIAASIMGWGRREFMRHEMVHLFLPKPRFHTRVNRLPIFIIFTARFRLAINVTENLGTFANVLKDTTPQLVFRPIGGKFKTKLIVNIGYGINKLLGCRSKG